MTYFLPFPKAEEQPASWAAKPSFLKAEVDGEKHGGSWEHETKAVGQQKD